MKNLFKVITAGFFFFSLFTDLYAQNLELSTSAGRVAKPDVKDELARKFGESITQEDLRRHLEVLASDEFEGRRSGQKGQKMAAEYIGNHYRSLVAIPIIEGDYYQHVPMRSSSWDSIYIEKDGRRFEFLEDFYCYRGSNKELYFKTDEIVFLGYGIDDEKYSDYSETDLTGKTIMIYSGEPKINGKSLISGKSTPSEWSTNWRKKLSVAAERGVALVMTIDDNVASRLNSSSFRYFMKQESVSLLKKEEQILTPNKIYITPEMAKNIMGRQAKGIIKNHEKNSEKGLPYSATVSGDLTISMKMKVTELLSENVLAFFPGEEMQDEVIVITAHYDHLGKDETGIYNGADDDGSGTVALLEIAEALSLAAKQGIKPSRSILVMNVSGEELGLLGSEFYTESPVIPLKNTVTNLNVDMVGRIDEYNTEDPNYVYVIGSNFLSSTLHEISEETAKNYSDLRLDYRYNDINEPNRYYYRSDHYNFAKNNIPVIFYFNGAHDDYHQITDTVDKIEFNLLEKRTRLIFYTLWELANYKGSIEVDMVGD